VRHAAAALGLVAVCALGAPARAEPVEPPADAVEGEDYVADRDDSLGTGDVEVGVVAEGHGGRVTQQRRRFRLHDDDGLDGTFREGRGDPLGGGSLERALKGNRVKVGRFAPRWGRGVALGGGREPWRRGASSTGATGTSDDVGRPASGQGLWLRHGARRSFEAVAGRVGPHPIAGARVRRGPAAIGYVGARRAPGMGSVTLAGDADDIELAIDGRGRWAVEAAHLRAVTDDAWLRIRARAGSAGFRPFGVRAVPPVRALVVEADGPVAGVRLRTLAASWRWRAGRAGNRGALEVQREMAHHTSLALGFEQQNGPRREVGGGANGARQGLWCEWRGVSAPVALAARHEVFGTRSFARDAVRVASSIRIEAPLAAGLELRLAHTSFRVRRGESLYLPEPASDRIVLRALTGDGERTRVELRAPIAGGRASAGLTFDELRGRSPRPRWSLEWTRRARARHAQPAAEEER
jgi:hypothetical protein